jgi:hypothetical protein
MVINIYKLNEHLADNLELIQITTLFELCQLSDDRAIHKYYLPSIIPIQTI